MAIDKISNAAGPQHGLIKIVPTSIVKGSSGSASVDVSGTITLSGTENVLLNGVFSSAYQNYKLIVTGNATYNLRFSLTGSVNTSSYGYSSHYMDWNGSTGSWYLNSGTNSGGIFGAANASIDIFNPALAVNTSWIGLSGTGSTNAYFGGLHNVATAYDGIQIANNSGGAMNATIRIYGYN